MVKLPSLELFKTLSPSELDRELGFQMQLVESKLIKKVKEINQGLDTRSWIGLDAQVLNTPYGELCEICEVLESETIETVVDLGAGYGRLGLVLSHYFPQAQFMGFEVIEPRVIEGNRIFEKWNLSHAQLVHKNILQDFEIPDAQVFFIYDFSNSADLKLILNYFSDMMFNKQFFLVARGKAVRSMIQHQFPALWVHEDVVHRENWSLYASRLGE